MQIEDLRPLLLVQHGRELLKVSTVYPPRKVDGHPLPGYVTAEVVYPVQPRTTVRSYRVEEIAKFKEPSALILNKYDDA